MKKILILIAAAALCLAAVLTACTDGDDTSREASRTVSSVSKVPNVSGNTSSAQSDPDLSGNSDTDASNHVSDIVSNTVSDSGITGGTSGGITGQSE